MKSKEGLKKLPQKGGKKARATATVALLAPHVLPAPELAAAPKPWKWTKAKREAVEMLCTGARKATIAKTLDLDRKTIYRWMQEPEFNRACQEWVAEQHRVRKGKRIRTIGVLSDTVTSIVGTHLAYLKEQQEHDKGATLSKDAIAQMGMLFRENRELMNQEREDFGDTAVQRVEANFNHFFAGPNGPSITETQRTEARKNSLGGSSFADYLRQHGDPALLRMSASQHPTQALITAGRMIASDPVLLQQLFDENAEEEK